MPSKGWSIGLLFLAAASAAAQSTGTPVYQAPYRPFSSSEIGISFSDPGPGFALEASYRTVFKGGIDGGLRGGFTDGGFRNSAGVVAGFDGRLRVIDHTESFPLDGAFTFGAGMSSSNGFTSVYLPVGLSIGRRILVEGSSISVVPYVHSVLTPVMGDGSGLAFTLAFGADVRINPRLDLRFSAGLGDRDGLGLTVAFLR